ncbi:MAG: class I SAM-dependent methyltransferase [Kiritimatiellae bacterium]|nr:class I SAM-dependent methyltransferase [Kiritimatiellia bacterium]
MKSAIVEHTHCRVCGRGDLVPLLSLGEQYAVAFLDSPAEPAVRAPLELVFCDPARGGCALVQLRHTLDHDLLYRRYWYRSGISTTMVAALRDVARAAERVAALKSGDLVIDIGCNDGTLLRQYAVQGLETIGFEPSNLWTLATDAGRIVHDYFRAAPFLELSGGRPARAITSIAMFYDLEDPNTFVRDIVACLAPDGVWIVQMNYLGLMIENATFDNISHEHLEYYSLAAMERLLDRHDLEVMDAELNDVNGGSVRLYIRRRGATVRPFDGADRRLMAIRQREAELGLERADALAGFARRIERIRDRLREVLEEERRAGRRVMIYGASTRGLVVLQYAGITAELIPLAVDKNPDKAGRYIAGTGIRCITLEQYRADPPDLLFVLPYQFQREIMLQEAEFLRRGGRMLFAIPEVRVVGAAELAAMEAGSR